jgi:hypothetical protein
VPRGGRVNAVPVEIGPGRGADGDAVEAGVPRVGQAEGARVGGQRRADLVQVHQDDVGARTSGGGGHQAAEQCAVELGAGVVGQRSGGRTRALIELGRQRQIREVRHEDRPRARRGHAVDDEVDVRGGGQGDRQDGAARIGRSAGGRDGLEDVVGAAQDADQIIGAEGSAGAGVGQKLVTHAGGQGGAVGAGAAEGVVDAAGHGRAGGVASGVEAQKLGENRTVGEPALVIGRRSRLARDGVQVAVVAQAVAEHDQTVVGLGAGGRGHGGGRCDRQCGKRGAAQETRHR